LAEVGQRFILLAFLGQQGAQVALGEGVVRLGATAFCSARMASVIRPRRV